MPAKKATAAPRTKRAAGLAQPTLAFRSQRKASYNPDKKGSTAALSRTPSGTTEIDVETVQDAPAKIESSRVSEKEQAKKENDAPSLAAKRRQLNAKSKEWNGLMKAANVAMGGLKPIHAGPETHDNIHHILRVFDLTSKYGPCVGITRLQRWERAKKWGLNPPEEIHDILTTEQGEDNASYRENVLYGWV